MAVKQRRRSKVEMVKILVGVDPVTLAAVNAVVQEEGLTFSAAICQMADGSGVAKEIRCRQGAGVGGSQDQGAHGTGWLAPWP